MAASNKGFELLNFQLSAHQNPLNIQIQIRHKDLSKNISIKDCAFVSTHISEVLEESNLIKKDFELEISSPGIGDVLSTEKEFNTFRGFPIEATCINKNKETMFKSGLLHQMSSEHLSLNKKGKIIKIPRSEVIEVRLTTPSG